MRFSEVPIGELVGKCATWSPKVNGRENFDYIDLSSVDKDDKVITSVERYLCSEAPSRARQLVKEDDVLVATVRPNLNGVAVVGEEHDGMTASTGYCVLRPIPGHLDPRFLFHWVKTRVFVQRMVDVATGANYPAVSDSKVKASSIPLPPLAEQKRIAGILDEAEALRAKRREAISQLDTFLQSTFLDMFGDPVTNPMEWEVRPLGEICDVRDGTHDSPKYVESGHPLLTSKNFKDEEIDFEGANLISEEDFAQINKRSKVDVGDLVMPMIGTIGNPVLVEREPHFAIKNVALIKFAQGAPDNRFIRALLCSHYFDHITSKANRGGTQKFVALKDLRGMPIPLPPLNLQRRFAAIVESVEQQRACMRAHLAELDALFASLQHRAFNGEL